MTHNVVLELRIALTVDNFDDAARFYREGVGLNVVEEWATPEGRGLILDAGRATLELIDPAQADLIDRVEVGQRVAGTVRFALEVPDVRAAAERVQAAGGDLLHEPTETPWRHLNARLVAPDGMQLTLFQALDKPD